MVTVAGVVVAGGRSSRMGTPKAALEWHGSTLLRRTVGVLQRVCEGGVVVVRAPGQPLPPLPAGVEVVEDPVEGRGPLQGIAVGLGAARDRAEAAFACSTDLPFLHPAFVRRVVTALGGGADAAVPHARGFRQPLAAAYRTALAPAVAALVGGGCLKPAFLFEQCTVTWLDDAVLQADPDVAAADPELDSLHNLNTPEDYAAARARPGPTVRIERFGTLAGPDAPRTVRAATLRDAAAAAGVNLDRHVVAALNGDQVTRDPELPLVVGDTLGFLTADAGG